MSIVLSAAFVLISLRALMEDPAFVGSNRIDAYLIPMGDAHQTGASSPSDRRLQFVSNFTGGSGTVLVTHSSALLWTDGRYYSQAERQLDFAYWELMKDGLEGTPKLEVWLANNPDIHRVGVDPLLYSKSQWDTLNSSLENVGKTLVQINTNLVDIVWDEVGGRPPKPSEPVNIHPIQYTGLRSREKLRQIRDQMTEFHSTVLILSELDQIAWLLNLRGSDIPSNPLFYAWIIVTHEQVEIFIDPSKLSLDVIDYLITEITPIEFFSYDEIINRTTYYNGVVEVGEKIWLSRNCNAALGSRVDEFKRILRATPPALLKLVKNPVEVQGMIEGHVRDGSAVVQFLQWLDESMENGEIITEISAGEKLSQFRFEQFGNKGLSFTPISASGPNGAVIHYRANAETNRILSKTELYLVDSGGQYLDTTTDITRTVHFGTPTPFEIDCFTRVLKAQIALRHAVFPERTVGNVLDVIARGKLWEVGLDYFHGTGHGIGSFLRLHEPPIGISYLSNFPDDPGLMENMFMSNEPGYYHEDNFGIRLENIVRTVVADVPNHFGNRTYLTFQDVTLVPIQIKMINLDLLNEFEVSYINEYHGKVWEIVGSYLIEIGAHEKVLNWLRDATTNIIKHKTNL